MDFCKLAAIFPDFLFLPFFGQPDVDSTDNFEIVKGYMEIGS
jgi:hypothetical protein